MPRSKVRKPGPRRKGRPRHGAQNFEREAIARHEERKERTDSGFINVHEKSNRPEYIEGAPRLSTVSGLQRSAHIAVQPRKPQEKHRPEPIVTYSPEVVAHADFLKQTEGVEAMNAYLKGAKQMPDQTKPLTDPGDEVKNKVVTGSIELALRDAEQKAAFHRKQVEIHKAEYERWTDAALSLRETLDTISKPVKLAHDPTFRQDNGRVPHGFWPNLLTRAGESCQRKPQTRSEWITLLHIMSKIESKQPAAAFISAAIAKKKIVYLGEGKYALPEWATEKAEAAYTG